MEFQQEPNRIFAQNDQGCLIAEITFPLIDDIYYITHTYVDSSLRGQGVAGALMEAALSYIAKEEGKMIPTCTYAAAWCEAHPEAACLTAPQKDK